MASADKDLEALRKEHKDQSDHLKRGGVLILTVLCVLVISFSRACQNASGDEVKTTLCQIDKIEKVSPADRNVSYIFDQFEVSDTTCETPCGIASPPPAAMGQSSSGPSLSPQTSVHVSTPSPEASSIPLPSPSPSLSVSPTNTNVSPAEAGSPNPDAIEEAKPSPGNEKPTEKEMKLAAECQRKLEADLESSAQKWFGVEPPIPGVKMNLDLRYWIFILPPLFFLSAIYLHILRMKIELLKAVAASRLSHANWAEITEVDRLYFEGNSPYMRFPSNMGAGIFIACYLFLPVYLFLSGASFWSYWATSSLVVLGFVIMSFALYSFSYAHFVTVRVNREISRLTNLPIKHTFTDKALGKSKHILQRVAHLLNPRIPLSSGALLILLTLWLTITKTGCEATPYKGYQVLLGEEGADWYTSLGLFEGTSLFLSTIGRVTYAMALMLAAVTILIIIIPRMYPTMERNARLRKALLAIAGAVLILGIIDFSTQSGLFPVQEGVIRLTISAVILGVWIRLALSDEKRRQKWIRIRPPLLIFSIPFYVLAVAFVFQKLVLPGLAAYFAGTNILFLGFMQLHYRSLAEFIVGIPPEPPPTSQSSSEDPFRPQA